MMGIQSQLPSTEHKGKKENIY